MATEQWGGRPAAIAVPDELEDGSIQSHVDLMGLLDEQEIARMVLALLEQQGPASHEEIQDYVAPLLYPVVESQIRRATLELLSQGKLRCVWESHDDQGLDQWLKFGVAPVAPSDKASSEQSAPHRLSVRVGGLLFEADGTADAVEMAFDRWRAAAVQQLDQDVPDPPALTAGTPKAEVSAAVSVAEPPKRGGSEKAPRAPCATDGCAGRAVAYSGELGLCMDCWRQHTVDTAKAEATADGEEVSLPGDFAADPERWSRARHKFEHGVWPLATVAIELDVSKATVRKRQKAEEWADFGELRDMPNAEPCPRHHKNRLTKGPSGWAYRCCGGEPVLKGGS